MESPDRRGKSEGTASAAQASPGPTRPPRRVRRRPKTGPERQRATGDPEQAGSENDGPHKLSCLAQVDQDRRQEHLKSEVVDEVPDRQKGGETGTRGNKCGKEAEVAQQLLPEAKK